jgi:hypothetical protein
MSQPTRMKGGKKVPVTGTVTMYEGLMAAVCNSPSERGDQDEGDSIKGGKNSSMDVVSMGSHPDELKQ